MAIEDLWYKNAVIYCLPVEKYMDSNDDGIGDFEGLSRRLPYLAGLGVTCVWLQPFYVSPNRDNGYDVSDYYGVDSRYGWLCTSTTSEYRLRVRCAPPVRSELPRREVFSYGNRSR